MALSQRNKHVLRVLAVYWPALFVATHIPVPQFVGRVGMSDKTLHIIAYLVLIFLWWTTISPGEKVNWKKAKVWATLALMVWYGAMDEWLQHFVGRGPSVYDFYADLAGTLGGLAILTVLSFWPAMLTFSAILIFMFTNITCVDLVGTNIFTNTAFHFLAYAGFSLVWIQYMSRFIAFGSNRSKWLVIAIAGPTALLAIVKSGSLVLGKSVWLIDCAPAVVAIISAVVIAAIAGAPFRNKTMETAYTTDHQQESSARS
jgi:VanZ family protein